MKDKFLKIAKCKDGASFYKKYPTEESFFAAHPEAKKLIKKAQDGMGFKKLVDSYSSVPTTDFQSLWNTPDRQQSLQMMQNIMPQNNVQKLEVTPINSPNYFTPSGNFQSAWNMPKPNSLPQQPSSNKTKGNFDKEFEKYAPMVGGLAQGIQMIGEQKRALKKAEQNRMLSGVMATASETKDIDANNVKNRDLSKQRRIMMQPINPDELFPTYGVGTNVLAKNGAEIKNTYSFPTTIFTDGEYEPLNDSNKIKQFEEGGDINYGGYANIANNVFDFFNQGPNAGSTIGASVGEAAGTALGGPLGGAIGKFAGNTIGGLVDTTQKKIDKENKQTERNLGVIQGQAFANNFQNTYSSFMEDGGLLPSQEFATLWGGNLKPISHNPYSPGTGITYNAHGQSHEESDGKGRTGIGLEVLGNGGIPTGEADVEIEAGEPISGNVVFGNLVADLAGKEYKGKKFKNIVADISKQEQKQNKIVDKASKNIVESDPITAFDLISMNSNKMMLKGADMKLKESAKEKEYLAEVQNTINNTAEQFKLVADDLAKGKIKTDKKAPLITAEFGKDLYKAQDGAETEDKRKYDEIMSLYEKAKAKKGKSKEALLLQQKFHEYFPEIAENVIISNGKLTSKAKEKGFKTFASLKKAGRNAILDSNTDEWFGPRTEQYIAKLKEKRNIIDKGVLATHPRSTSHNFTPPEKSLELKPLKKDDIKSKNKNNNTLFSILSQVNPYLRQPIRNPLDPNQLMGENFALTHNQVDPVQANLYNPQLITPFDISLQDQLNETTASFNAARRTAGNNPAAQAAIAGQEAMMKQRILGEQFRMNQTQKANTYNQNIATLNDADLRNLGILDQQFVRQNQAQSNARAITQNALSSISDKVQKNRLENFTANVMANRYPDYTFTNEGVLRKLPTFQQFEIPTVGDYGQGVKKYNIEDDTHDGYEKVVSYKKKKPAKNGSILKDFKNL
jgi:hypothetical protein